MRNRLFGLLLFVVITEGFSCNTCGISNIGLNPNWGNSTYLSYSNQNRFYSKELTHEFTANIRLTKNFGIMPSFATLKNNKAIGLGVSYINKINSKNIFAMSSTLKQFKIEDFEIQYAINFSGFYTAFMDSNWLFRNNFSVDRNIRSNHNRIGNIVLLNSIAGKVFTQKSKLSFFTGLGGQFEYIGPRVSNEFYQTETMKRFGYLNSTIAIYSGRVYLEGSYLRNVWRKNEQREDKVNVSLRIKI